MISLASQRLSRGEHRARQGRPFVDAPALADAIDAELVEPADETGPERCPEWREGEMRYPAEGDDLPNGDMHRPVAVGS